MECGPLHKRVAASKDFGLIPGQDTEVAAGFPGGELQEATYQYFFLRCLAFSFSQSKSVYLKIKKR